MKASSGPALPTIELTANEWLAAESYREGYVLALIGNVKTAKPLMEFIVDPFGLVERGGVSVEPIMWRLRRIAAD